MIRTELYVKADIPSIPKNGYYLSNIEGVLIPLFQRVNERSSLKGLLKYIEFLEDAGVELIYSSPLTEKRYRKRGCLKALGNDLESAGYRISQLETYKEQGMIKIAFRLRGNSGYGFLKVISDKKE